MKLHWLLSSILGVLLLGLPANAGKLISWEFKSQNNRLEFTTDEGVEPQVKLIDNPTRLVIELPETTLDGTTVKEKYLGAVRGFRVGQSSDDTVSLVVEVAPGYTIDVDRVELKNISDKRWTIEIPNPRIAPAATATRTLPPPNINNRRVNRDPLTRPINPRNNPRPVNRDRDPLARPINPANSLPPVNRDRDPLARPINPTNSPRTVKPNAPNPSQLDNTPANANRVTNSSPYIQATSNGFFVKINGNRSNRVSSERDGNTISFDLENITLPEDLVSQSIATDQYGIKEINFAQTSSSSARITLQLIPNSPNWLATFSRMGGLLLVPRGELPVFKETESIVINTPTNTNNQTSSTTVTAIAVAPDNSRLIIRSDRNITTQTKFLRNGIYEIQVPNAQLIEPFPNPKLKAGSPISQLRVRQEGSDVIFLVTTRLGVRLGNVIQQSSNLIALPITMPTQTVVDLARDPYAQYLDTSPRNSRPLVVIDPGHGGKDPGTIGIGGVQEKNVILPISLDVAAELKKQGIEVRLTRDRDYFVSLQGRTDFANKINADLFVSIHANAINLSRPDVNGLETYYYQNGRRLSEIIHWNVLNSVNIRNRNVRRARFYVLRHSKMPATLVEVGFLTGAEDSARLKDPSHRQKMAKAIAQGIIQYIREKKI